MHHHDNSEHKGDGRLGASPPTGVSNGAGVAAIGWRSVSLALIMLVATGTSCTGDEAESGGDADRAGADVAAAAARSRATLVVSNEGSNSLSFIDPAGDSLIGTVAVGNRPRGMAVSPDGKTVYVAVGRDNAVAVVDVASRLLKAKIPAGVEPAQVALGPDGKTLYVSNESTGMVTAVDVTSGSAVFSVTVGGEPEGVAVTPDGQSVYVSSVESGTVTVLDARTGQRRTDLKVGARPRFVAFTHDGAYAVITSEGGGSVTVVDLPKNVALKTVSVGDSSRPSGLAFSPDDETAYLASGADRILLFSMSALAVTDTIIVAGRPSGVALDRAGAILYSADSRSDQLSVVDVVHHRLLRTINIGERPYTVVITGND